MKQICTRTDTPTQSAVQQDDRELGCCESLQHTPLTENNQKGGEEMNFNDFAHAVDFSCLKLIAYIFGRNIFARG